MRGTAQDCIHNRERGLSSGRAQERWARNRRLAVEQRRGRTRRLRAGAQRPVETRDRRYCSPNGIRGPRRHDSVSSVIAKSVSSVRRAHRYAPRTHMHARTYARRMRACSYPSLRNRTNVRSCAAPCRPEASHVSIGGSVNGCREVRPTRPVFLYSTTFGRINSLRYRFVGYARVNI